VTLITTLDDMDVFDGQKIHWHYPGLAVLARAPEGRSICARPRYAKAAQPEQSTTTTPAHGRPRMPPRSSLATRRMPPLPASCRTPATWPCPPPPARPECPIVTRDAIPSSVEAKNPRVKRMQGCLSKKTGGFAFQPTNSVAANIANAGPSQANAICSTARASGSPIAAWLHHSQRQANSRRPASPVNPTSQSHSMPGRQNVRHAMQPGWRQSGLRRGPGQGGEQDVAPNRRRRVKKGSMRCATVRKTGSRKPQTAKLKCRSAPMAWRTTGGKYQNGGKHPSPPHRASRQYAT
jgi:hypothetical protein